MQKKITLKRIFHRNEWRYAIIFDYDKKHTDLVRSINKATWSQTNMCWYAGAEEKTLKQILNTFRESADIDISRIVSHDKVVTALPEISVKTEKEDDPINSSHLLPVKQAQEKQSVPSVKATKQPDFAPVIFTVSQADSRLIIKFTGKYDPEWIDELKTFGRYFYNSVRREWRIVWSQLAVDSLSDYFSSRGVEVIVKKQEVADVLKDMRQEQGSEVRNRIIGNESIEGIELVRKHLEEKRYSKRTIESYTAHLELFFKYFHEKDPIDITEADVAEFIENYILKLGYSASYQNIMISAIKTYYIECGERIIQSDSFERPRRSRALPKVFSKEDVMRIFSATLNNKHKLILWMIYSCGLRRSEVINIKLSDLDFDRGILHIREGKGNVDRMVPVPQKVWEKIRTYIKVYQPSEYLFVGQAGGRYSVESVYSVFKQSLKRAGIQKDVGVHSLRHSYATHLHESGLDIRYIQELLGHKSTRTTEIYTHVSRRNLFAIRSPIEDMDI
jgi:integrase/recombinase XerD